MSTINTHKANFLKEITHPTQHKKVIKTIINKLYSQNFLTLPAWKSPPLF